MRMTQFLADCLNRVWRGALVLAIWCSFSFPCAGQGTTVNNLALAGLGATARSWEPGVTTVPEHEPSKVNDGSLHTYWAVRAVDLPADIGVEWPTAQKISSVVVRYFDGRMVRGPAMARTQEWARLQYWDQKNWKDTKAQIVGQETSSVRYILEPVTTTRLRLLFTEPPDPEGRRLPDRLGIYVCELEAYHDVPFQVVNPPARLVPVRGDREGPYYNEWGSDNSYDRAGPLVIEPKPTRIVVDTLRPTLIVAESRWAKTPTSVATPRKGVVQLKNGFLQIELSTTDGLKEARLTNLITGETINTPNSRPFVILTSKGELAPANFTIAGVDTAGSTADTSQVRVDMTSPAADLSVHYELRRQDHFYHKWITLKNKGDSQLQVLDATVSSLGLDRLLDLFAGPELTYPVSRMEKGGFFECLETVYWDHHGDTMTYYPGVTVAPAGRFESEKAVVGVYRLAGEQVDGFDRGVREWVIEYHTQVSPVHPQFPDIYLEGWDAKVGTEELQKDPEWTEKFFATAHKLGVQYMDSYTPTDIQLLAPPDLTQRWVDLANKYNIATGWWNDFGSRFGWGYVSPYWEPYLCKLTPEAETYFRQIVELVRKYNLRGFHWADFWTVWPCDKTDHGHLPGKYSIYAQGQRMVRLAQEMHEAAPALMLGADSGLDNPQYGRFADSRHHGGGYDANPAVEPDIHLDRLYADMNRGYLYGLAHEGLLRPWYHVLNNVNHFGMESHHHDRAGYRYGLLSALALAGQLTFDDAPDNVPESEFQFTRRWEDWARANKDYLQQNDKLFDRSVSFSDILQGDADSLTGYSHIRGDRGYIFLINPGPALQIAELALSLDVPASTHFIVEEVYPGGMNLRGPVNYEYPQGSKLRVTVPGKEVRILWIAPAAESKGEHNFQPEDLRPQQISRYIVNWRLTGSSAETATLESQFDYPQSGREWLSSPVPEAAWAKEPWAHDKAYLVFILKDENVEQNDQWVGDGLLETKTTSPAGEVKFTPTESLTAMVNGVPKALHPFKTLRTQERGKTRCYFASLDGETKPGPENRVSVMLPVDRGLVFAGAYLDLPDQMPDGR
ncbi:MAG: hypothetical protein ABSH52_13245 [Terriglobia bacterium]|jgi:hypothetical protein